MTDEAIRLRKPIRLPADAYGQSGSCWLVTISTADRRPYFGDDPSLAGATLAMLTDEAPRRGIHLHLVCLMPDHAHLLVFVVAGDIVASMVALKSLSTKVFYGFGYAGALWHRSFHDQGIRGEPAFEEAARYILNNPVVAGVASTWEAYDLIDGTWIGK